MAKNLLTYDVNDPSRGFEDDIVYNIQHITVVRNVRLKISANITCHDTGYLVISANITCHDTGYLVISANITCHDTGYLVINDCYLLLAEIVI